MRPSQQITPTIRLVRPLAEGAMGRVWVARHLALNTDVAVKFMAPASVSDPELAARFRQEAQAAANIKSPHVAQILDFGVTPEGEPYIVMELLEGETLGQRLRRVRRLPLRDLLQLVTQAAKALSRAHRLGIVHRDIKPDNIFLVDVEGEMFVKVLDFGIAKQLQGDMGAITATGRTLGTPLYMSPEQFVGSKYIDHRTDIWSLAVVAYHALTGRLPFACKSLGDLANAVRNGNFLRPGSILPDLPATVDAWMARALQPDLELRFGSVLDLAATLEVAVGGAVAGRAAVVATPVDVFMTTARVPGREEEHEGATAQEQDVSAAPAALKELSLASGTIRLLRGSILSADVEAIVCPADPQLRPDFDGISTIIHRAAGPLLVQETSRRGGCKVGGAVITAAGRLSPPIRWVVHAVAPAYWADREPECDQLLRRACEMSLQLAEMSSVRSIAFPALGTGVNGYALERAASILLTATVDYLAIAGRGIHLVLFALPTAVGYEAYAQALAKLARRRT
ncbi:serine/threonine-protein kinase [Sorangium sp. So ce726]|uniref:serine/threonine-protein kinase n=1 Tax=Sorangium sp. So ce726 TaxID=3133319 RepID=UPI003F612C1A